MFKQLLNPGGEEEPSIGYSYEEKKKFQWKWWHFVLILVVAFPYISLFVLFGVVSNIKETTTKNKYYSTVSASSLYTSSPSTIATGTVVSLTAAGAIQAGGGTSIYKNIVNNIDAKCPSYLSMDAIYSDAYIVSYADKTATNSVLQVVKVGTTPNTGSVASTLASQYYFYEVQTLSNGLFVGITQDSSNITENAYIVAGTVDAQTYKINLYAGVPTRYAFNYSMNPQITRLSDTTFAVAYYSIYPSKLATRYGSVNPATLAVTLSPEYFYADNANSSMYANIVGMTESQYMLMYFDSYDPANPTSQSGTGPLNVIVANVVPSGTIETTEIEFSNVTTLTNSALSYYFAVTALTNETAVVAYIDANNNYGIKCQTIELTNNIANTPVVFGSSWLVTSGQALMDLTNWIMDIDIAKVSDSGEFMVLYSDISNDGAMTATMGELSASGDLIRASPDFILNTGNTNIDSVYSWGAIASGVTTTLSSQTAIMTSLTNFDCQIDAVSTFSLMEVKPSPYGVISSYSGNVADVTLSGTLTATVGGTAASNLVQGMNYYSNSMGGIVSGDIFYGREGASSSVSLSSYYYIEDSVSNTIVTLSSRIGIAVATNAMYIQPVGN